MQWNDFYAVVGCLEVGQVENWVERGQNFMKSDPNHQNQAWWCSDGHDTT